MDSEVVIVFCWVGKWEEDERKHCVTEVMPYALCSGSKRCKGTDIAFNTYGHLLLAPVTYSYKQRGIIGHA